MQQVAMGEASDEHAEHERHVRLPPPPPYHHVARQQQQQQWRMATATAAFHSRRPPMNPISKFVPTPLQQTSIVLEDPYQVPRMLLQPDKFLVWQSSLVDLISSSLRCFVLLISVNLYIRIQREIKLMSGILVVFSFVNVGCVGLPLDDYFSRRTNSLHCWEINCEQKQKQDHHRSTSGLEELIMSCTSAGIKGVSININQNYLQLRPKTSRR